MNEITVEKYRCIGCRHIFEHDEEEFTTGGLGGLPSFDEGCICPKCESLAVKLREISSNKMQVILDLESDKVTSYIGDDNEDRYLVRILVRLLDVETKEEIHDDRNWLMFLKLMPNAESVSTSDGNGNVTFSRAEILFSIDKDAYEYHNAHGFADFLPKRDE